MVLRFGMNYRDCFDDICWIFRKFSCLVVLLKFKKSLIFFDIVIMMNYNIFIYIYIFFIYNLFVFY